MEYRDESFLTGERGEASRAPGGRNAPGINKRRQALLEKLQIELRVYSMYAQTRFEDRGVDQKARHLADNECENAQRRFDEMVVNGGRSSIRIRPEFRKKDGPHTSEPDYYPDRVPVSEGSVVEMIMSRTLRPTWVVPADGDTLLRQAIVVDHCFERAAHEIHVLAVWTDHRDFKGVRNPFRDYVSEVVEPIREEFQKIAQADHDRGAAYLPGPALHKGALETAGARQAT